MISGSVPTHGPGSADASAKAPAAGRTVPAQSFERILGERTETQLLVAARKVPAFQGSAQGTAGAPGAPAQNEGLSGSDVVVRAGSIVPDHVFRFGALGLLHTRELADGGAPDSSAEGARPDAKPTSGSDLAPVGFHGAIAPAAVSNVEGLSEHDTSVPETFQDRGTVAPPGLSPGCPDLPLPSSVSGTVAGEPMEAVPSQLPGFLSGPEVPQLRPDIAGDGLPHHAGETKPAPTNRRALLFSSATQTTPGVSASLDSAEAPTVTIRIADAAEGDASLLRQVHQLLARYGLVAGKIVVGGRIVHSDEQKEGDAPWL